MLGAPNSIDEKHLKELQLIIREKKNEKN